ncbi:MAG: translocation/assembly module TamB domain-containing protein [Rhizobiales bacterium]|nr:translocation/assembly module TamB domain-containing protein [Hyphomicrobiales bacterium]
MMRKPGSSRFSFRRLGLGFALIAMGLMLHASVPHAQEDQGVLAGFISKLLSTPTSRVTVGAVEGPLSSDATIRNVSVADADGVFLKIDTIRLVWRRAALLAGRIEVQNLEIGKIEFTRKPKGDDTAPPSDGPLLPELPVKLQVDKFTLGELALGEPILGVAARFSASGNASLGAPSEGLQATLDIRRLDAPGQSAVRLRFAPASQQLDLALQHDEPAGGIVARLIGLPGLPPVKLDVAGAGVLDDWRGRVAFDAGAGTDARGEARLGRSGPQRRLGLDLTAHIESLLPPAVATIFAGTTSLGGGVIFADDGAIGIERLRLASDLAELAIAGRLDAAKVLDVTVTARALPSSDGATRRGEASLARLVFDATAKGPVTGPRVDGKLDLAGLSSAGLKLQALTATLAVEPLGTTGPQRFRIAMDGRATGIAPADRGLAEALGDTATLVVRATVDDKTIADVTEARIATPNLALGFTGRAGSTLVDGKVQGDITRLAALSTMADRRLAGRATLQVTLTGDPSLSEVTARIDGRGSELSLGDATADRLVGRQLTLAGTARTARTGITLDQVAAQGQHVQAVLNGRIGKAALDLTGDLALPDLARADQRLAGAARVNARVTGSRDDPDATLTLTAPDIRALNRPIRDLRLTLAATRLVSAPGGTLSAGGDVNGKPLIVDIKGGAAGQGWRLDQLAAQLGSVRAEGQGTLDAAGLAAGSLTVSARDLDDIAPLTLMRLGGALEATVIAGVNAGRQHLAVTADGRRLVIGTNSLNSLKADLRTEDMSGRTVLNGTAAIDQLVAGGETIERIGFNARPNGAASDISLTALARGFNLAAAGKLGLGQAPRLDLASFSAARSGARIALAAPATLVLENGQVVTERLVIGVQGGEIELKGKLGSQLDLVLNARRVPLAAIDIVAPGTGLRGTLDAHATLKGPAAAPRGPFDATIKGLSAPQTRSAGVPALDITARGAAEGERANLDVRISGGSALAFTITGTAPIAPQGAFDLRARGTLDAGLANASLAGTGQRVAGRVAIDGSLRGTRARPDIQGTATLTNGAFSDPIQGVALTAIEGRVSGRGDSIVIERLTARTKNAGTIAVSGRVAADPERGFPADLKISARDAQLVSSDIADLIASLDLSISGPLSTAPRLSGRINVTSLEIRVPDRLPSSAEPLRDARHVAPPRQTRDRLAQIARQRAAAQQRRGRGAAFNAALDLSIDAPSRVFVRGRGIDAELGGTLRLAGTSNDPRAIGAFELRRGRFSLLTQRLDFARGRLTFGGGDVIPDLDFVAETRAAEVTASIAITGRATEPQFTLTSSPSLPQDEVLSRLLFARASGGLSPFQAVQLAQAVAQLAGSGGGPDAFERTRRALGLNDLDVGMGTGGPTVGISRNINDRVRIGVRAGARPENSAVGADIDLTRRLRLQSEVGADGRASVGIGAEIEY